MDDAEICSRLSLMMSVHVYKHYMRRRSSVCVCARARSLNFVFLPWSFYSLFAVSIFTGDVLLTVFTTDNITIEHAVLHIMPFFVELQFVSLQQGEHVYNVISKSSVTELDGNTVGVYFPIDTSTLTNNWLDNNIPNYSTYLLWYRIFTYCIEIWD